VGFTTEVGTADTGAVLSRSAVAGVAFSLARRLTVTMDGSHGLTGSAPTWSFSMGLGTAFAGLSPVNPTSPLRRLKSVFGSKVTATSGYSKTGSATATCKKSGTC
jgi:hypothetical protein